MDKGVNNNGYEYVDLGLPSGTLWATKNVGAKNPSNYGLYFQWGDTKGYKAKQVREDKQFTWCDYKLSINGNYRKFNRYTNRGNKLKLEDDAAHVHMGGDWHMPTPEQFQELLDNTTRKWTISDGGTYGIKFTSKKNKKSMFVPGSGEAKDGSLYYRGMTIRLWSSMQSAYNIEYGQYFEFYSERSSLLEAWRCTGYPVRGVIDKKDDDSKDKKINMNENLNLVEILKDAPQGTKLWSSICGELEFLYVRDSVKFPCIVCNNDSREWVFLSNGKFSPKGECVLFPSKENRDWSTFKVSKEHKHFEPYQKVLIKAYSEPSPNHKIWFPDIYLFFEEQNSCHRVAINKYIHNDDNIIPFEGNEDKVGKAIE